ncbi:MAG: DUF1501 domain-containing protein [Phycisphaeraceae bacterium]|nr:DUF1501 domain-containing protein [Phycisphaeraceae bacterium]
MSEHECIGCNEYQVLSRRQFIGAAGMMGLLATSAPAWLPRVAFAKDYRGGARDVIVAVFLRGASDGLSMVVPYADPQYAIKRPTLKIPPPTDPDTVNRCIDLNGYMGLHPSLGALKPFYDDSTVAFIQATGSNDPSRSHFDAQRFMEVGKPGDASISTGWLARHLMTTPPLQPNAAARAIGIASNLEIALLGAPKAVPVPTLANTTVTYNITGPGDTRAARLAALNTAYNLVADPVRTAASNTQATINMLAGINFSTYTPNGGAVYPATSFGRALKSTAALIRANVGVEAVCIDKGGWDTHSAQGNFGTGTMSANLTDLGNALAAFRRDVLVSTSNVTVVVMSEFGRRVLENASAGTDHGHGNCMIVMGGHVNGNQVFNGLPAGQGGPGPGWPTLSNLYQNLDLQVATDYRDVLAEITQNRLNNSNLATVFPGYTPTFPGVVSA